MESSPVAPHPGSRAPGSLRQSLLVLVVLGILVLLEVGIVKVPGIARVPAVAALVALAVSKALLIALFYMHLRRETRALRLTVLLPFLLPAAYALALVGDAAWRMLR